nr:MAG TPA: hypothetical protein [Caudoviricetes sp.]
MCFCGLLMIFWNFYKILYTVFVHYIEHLILLSYYSCMIFTDSLQIHR